MQHATDQTGTLASSNGIERVPKHYRQPNKSACNGNQRPFAGFSFALTGKPPMAIPMQRLTVEQKRIRRYRIERDRLVGRIMADNRSLTSREALAQAIAIIKSKGRKA